MLLLLQIPAYADMLLSIIRAPERRFWKAFSKMLGGRFLESHRDTLINLVFIPHQACLMADAIVRTLWREYVSQRELARMGDHGAIRDRSRSRVSGFSNSTSTSQH